MNKWHLLIAFTVIYMGIQTLRADDDVVCSVGHSTFGKFTCGAITASEPAIDAYFLGATTFEEVQRIYPGRYAKLRERCERKVAARGLTDNDLHLSVQIVTVCTGKRSFQEPCVKNEDCIENVCHPDRGTCSAVFTVPLGVAQ